MTALFDYAGSTTGVPMQWRLTLTGLTFIVSTSLFYRVYLTHSSDEPFSCNNGKQVTRNQQRHGSFTAHEVNGRL